MYNAPAVQFPVGRSGFHGLLLLLTWLAGMVVCAAWLTRLDSAGWRLALASLTVAVVGLNASRSWWTSPQGLLHWDGQVWRLEAAKQVQPIGSKWVGEVDVHLDFQLFMLLSLRNKVAGVQWFWLSRSGDTRNWPALRRAVHARARGTKQGPDDQAGADRSGNP
jgi:hypothetical protein